MDTQMLSGMRSRVVVSTLAVIAVMLALQSALSLLKFRTLAVEATSSRLQVTASAIDVVIRRAEAVGLGMHEISDLDALIERERLRDPKIHQILLLDLQGATLARSGGRNVLLEDMNEVLPRVLTSDDKTITHESGAYLYAGRILRDSSNSIMGAILISEHTDELSVKVRDTWSRLTFMYLAIFAIVAISISLFSLLQLHARKSYFRKSGKADLGTFDPKSADELQKQISKGKKVQETALLDISNLSNMSAVIKQSDQLGER
ncbi:hypothetical protein SAMN05444141_104397 [Pseudovibrio denitrificans]|uniref:Uncharacterized protein n=1 Tax=Pseudovibrio denitrificans TaxID=258256 RepID=A0A1I7BVS0_9HYPH|nr:hypothetical protein [Pseudovibrio denitrificans]SFT91275.1 hypothetical protein SAMN05444141_104397 [Pseudovibrio denitrificans]